MDYLAQVDIGATFGSPFGQTKTVGDLVSLILSASFAIAGIVVLFIFLFAGFKIISGAGQNDPEAAAQGRQAATAAAIGLVIIFVAYWIIRIIELITGVPFITG